MAASPQPRDRRLNLPNPGVPPPVAIPIALRRTTIRRTLTTFSASQHRDAELHAFAHHHRPRLAQHIRMLTRQRVARRLTAVMLRP